MHRSSFGLIALALLWAAPAHADISRLQAIGDVGLLTEDSSNVFTNPALMGTYSNRVWFSLGVDVSAGPTVSLSPLGGGAIRLGDVVTLGVVLNRAPTLYDFDAAIWPVMLAYLPGGPGGPLVGPAGPSEQSAPLRFPVDIFAAIGDRYSPLRLGLHVYYGVGANRDWLVEDRDGDELEESSVVRRQTHLVNATIGVSGGSVADKVRPEGWIRVGYMAAWHDQVAEAETSPGTFEPSIDRILAMDRDLRVGGGFRIHLGDAEQGVLVTPGFRYDGAGGVWRFDDNRINPDSPAELAERVAEAHDAEAGVGVAWRGDGLLVQGTATLGVQSIAVVDSLFDNDDNVEEFGDQLVSITAPELSVGAEYRVLPALLVRAGVRSTVLGGRTIQTLREGSGTGDSITDDAVDQRIATLDPQVTLAATGGLGLQVKRFHADVLLGGLFFPTGDGTTNFFSRIDLGFSFD